MVTRSKTKRSAKREKAKKARKGGNGTVTFSGVHAKKTLNSKGRGYRLRVERFAREVELLRALSSHAFPAVVPILDANLDADPPWYKMPRYDGDLETIVEGFKASVGGVVNALLPIVNDLSKLADREIFHRDIKPANILYKKDGEGVRLSITDFGIAFVGADSEARLTQEFRSVGAQAYRAPEYQHGRVEAVSEKGDVFSLGKMLWHMVNGVRFEVFPYTLWHPREYDLGRRFPHSPGINRLNLIIAACVHHDPAKRPTMRELANQLTTLAEGATRSENDTDTAVSLMAFEARNQLRQEESARVGSTFCRLFGDEWKRAKDHLAQHYANSEILETVLLAPLGVEQAIARLSSDFSDSSLLSAKNNVLRVSARVRTRCGTRTEHPCIDFAIVTTAGPTARSWTLDLYESHAGPTQQVKRSGREDESPEIYREGVLIALFEEALAHLASLN